MCATSAARPAPRDQVSLNGTWEFIPKGKPRTTIRVPEFWDARPGFTVDEATYVRAATVPSSWRGKVIKLEFEGVNFIADVYVNGSLVGRHVGGWVPFWLDITDKVTPGRRFVLKVRVKGGAHEPIVDRHGRVAWPVGWYGHKQHWGICFDVWLRGYGSAHIEDAFIKTSYRQKHIAVEYTIKNSARVSRTVVPEFEAIRIGGRTEKRARGPTVRLSPGEKRTVVVRADWRDPACWDPESPTLYTLVSRLMSGSTEMDRETRRFGFREIYIVGNQYYLNGHRVNLIGSSITWHGQGFRRARYEYVSRDTWRRTISVYKSINVNVIRFHQEPPPSFIYDVADEEGLFLIAESAVYSRDYLPKNYEPYIRNSIGWQKEWIRGCRNHPSIVIWSAENEMISYGRRFTAANANRMGEAIRELDDTRPIIYDGDKDLGSPDVATVNLHYPEGYGNSPRGSIYSWADRVHKSKPTGVGEFLTSYDVKKSNKLHGKVNRWWAGTWVRGLRYAGFTDIRPYTLQFVLESYKDKLDDPLIVNLRESFAPVALFDKAYDDLGIDPIKNGGYPGLQEGRKVTRTLVLYNDEHRNDTVRVEVEITSGSKTYARGATALKLPLGEHIDVPCSFEVPYVGGAVMEMVLRTEKDGVAKFTEAKRFRVMDTGKDGTSSRAVTFGAR